MKRKASSLPPWLTFMVAALALLAGTGRAQSAAAPKPSDARPMSVTLKPRASSSMASLESARVLEARRQAAETILQKRAHRITQAQREEAAKRAAIKRATANALGSANLTAGAGSLPAAGMTMPAQGGKPNYFGPEPNWAWSPPIRKFVDAMPGLGSANANGLGQYIPVAVADTSSYPGSDYYEIGLVEYTEKLHTDLNPTTLRGYVQLNDPANPATRDATGKITAWPHPQYLGPLILASKDKPVRIKFYNLLPTGAGGKLFLPVDKTEMGAGMGPLGMNITPGNQMDYTENRGTLHLHGGLTPWISDGTPHQWITPAGENTDYPKGVSVSNVPDMPDPGDGSETFYYSNQQSARLMFYHDHAYGITRLNVYAGEAAGYLLTDAAEQDLITRGVLPDLGIPLIIQDKTFVDPAKVLATDPTWPFALDAAMNDLWYPHVYMPNQNPNDMNGANSVGRWDYGPWFWPPWPVTNLPITNPDGTVTPNLPDLSMTMEAFQDTPMVNGTPYPYLNVEPKTYRFRILNAANDRMWNLGLYMADPAQPTEILTVPATFGAVYPAGYTDAWGNQVGGTAVPFPTLWKSRTTGQPGDILDGRESGVPDPRSLGPSMVQIGTEGGFLPTPVVWPNTPIGVNRNPKDITVGNVLEHNLFIGPAERADVLIDFSQYAGKTIILYNDGPAAVPAADSRLDYYTGDLDQQSTGGAASTLPGYGPNTRTIMQFRVAANPPAPAYDMARLNDEFATTATHDGVFKRSQDPIIVPQVGYNTAYNDTFPSDTHAYSRIDSTSLTFTPLGATAPITINFEAKAIHELFENSYGRMSAFLGLEMKFTNGTNQTTLPFGYIDPATEIIDDSVAPLGTLGDGTQIWKITHNGVDTHPIHFHLFNVQLINRVGWDGAVKPPEPNELGWKETVRMNPLEDCIVAVRAVSPKIPFGVPDSIRPLDPTMPIGSTEGFTLFGPTGQPVTTTNQLYNFGWEYVWHCHILSHEEMDMMRPIVFNVARAKPGAPILSAANVGTSIGLTWIDPTPASAPTTPGNPSNEIGFRVERADVSKNGKVGTYAPLGTALANATQYTDTTALSTATYSYRVIAYNVAGETVSNEVLSGVAIPPVTTAAVTPQPNAAGWNNTDVSVTLSAVDPYGSGIASISYTLDGVQNVVNNSTVTFIVTGDAIHSLVFHATNNAGGVEADQSLPIRIDSTLPTASSTVHSVAAPGWNNANVTIDLTGADGLSGVASMTYTIGGTQTVVQASSVTVPVTTEGSTTIDYFATDVAGNVEATQTVTVNIDKTAPTLIWGTPSPAPNAAGWYNAVPVSIPWTASDALSGVAGATTGTVAISSQGAGQTGSVTVSDNAGNSQTYTSPAVNIDLTAPSASAVVTPTPNAAGWNNSNVTVNLTGTDALSGVASITYSVNNGAATTVAGSAASIPVTTEGITTISFFATDVAGNSGTAQTVTVKLDRTLPTLSWGTITPAKNAAGWYTTLPVSIPWIASDTGSGVAGVASGSVTFSAQGAGQTQTVTVTDVAGNSQTFTSPAVSIDTTAPTVLVGATPTSTKISGKTTSVTIYGSVTDAVSGVNLTSGTYTVTSSIGTRVPGGTFAIAANGTYSFKISNLSAKVAQTYTITVSARDKATNSSSASTTFVIK